MSLLFLWAFEIKAQIPFENPLIINTLDGMPSDRVYCVAQDDQGFAWIGTDSGLVRTDGHSLEVFMHDDQDSLSIRNDIITDILPDNSRNEIWLATTTILTVLDLDTKTFRYYENEPGNPYSVPNYSVSRLLKDKEGNIWIGYRDSGMVRYRPESDDFERFICTGEPADKGEPLCNFWAAEIEEDPYDDDVLWIGTQKGILEFSKSTGQYRHFFHTVKNNPERERRINAIRRMLVHPNGKIYTGSWYHGILVFDIKEETFSPLDPCYPDHIPRFISDVTTSLFMESEDLIWINSRDGLQLYNVTSNCITRSFSNNEKLNKWYSIDHVDKEGRIWSATQIDGLKIYDPLMQQYKNKYFEDPEHTGYNFARKIVEDTLRKKIYVGAQNSRGLFIYDINEESWECITPESFPKTGSQELLAINDILQLDDGSILILEDRALYLYQQGARRIRILEIGIPEFPRLRKMIRGRNGNIWISGYNVGLVRLEEKTKKIEIIDKKKYEERWNRVIGGDWMTLDRNGNIWMREHYGILIYHPEVDSITYIPKDLYPQNAYAGMGPIISLENGEIWISSYREFLGYAHADSLNKGILFKYGKNDGLIGSKIYSTSYYKGRLLVFTDLGMQEFDLLNKKFGTFYYGEYGLGTHVSNSTLLSTGEIASGRTKHISIFNPDSLKRNDRSPLPYISSFKVFNRPVLLDNDIRDVDTLYLKYNENFFSIELSALGFILPEKTRFRYMLEGFDDEWQEGTERKFATYTNVPGGEYHFLLESYNEEESFAPLTSVTYIMISTVWWKSYWFLFILLLLISLLIYGIYKYRINQVRNEERLKSSYEKRLVDVEMSALRAQMNPHFIFNSLNSIEYYIINNEPEKASDYLNRFSRLIRLILQNSKNSEVLLKDDLEALRLYIEIESLRFDNRFDYEVKTEKNMNIDSLSIPPMLMQPYVENAIWHGLLQKKDGKGKIDITLQRDNGYVICRITDNGIGRKAANQLKSKSATKKKSYGMKITSDRLSMLNKLAGEKSSVIVKDLFNDDGSPSGTSVTLTIPILSTIKTIEP